MYWTLETAGFENLSIINGGLSTWRAAQYPLRTAEGVTWQKTQLSLSYAEDWRAEAPYILQLLEALSGTVLIDSRTEAFMHGARKHTLASTVGTLPDAKCL